MFFRFPEDARWNEDRQAVEFGIGIGEYEGVARVPRRVFQRLLDGAVTPERCLEAYHLQRTRFELAVERKLRNRQLSCSLSRGRARFSVPRRRMVQAVGCTGQETGPEDAG